MNILITNQSKTESLKTMEMVCGKKTALVFLSCKSGQITTICKNASHAAWRGAGKISSSWDEALEGYKSAEMRAMINFARAEFA